jgi:hypothetical protein
MVVICVGGGVIAVAVRVAASVFRVVRNSSMFGVSVVLTIAGVGMAVRGERVRDGLGSESLWYLRASDNATVRDRSFYNLTCRLVINRESNASSEYRFFSFKICE